MRNVRNARPGSRWGVAALLAIAASLAPWPAFGRPQEPPPLTMEEVEVRGSGDLPETFFAPAPSPERGSTPVRYDLLREQTLAPISPGEDDDDGRRTGVAHAETDDRD